MNYVVGYISGNRVYVTEMLEHMGWRRATHRRFNKDGRCIFWLEELYQLPSPPECKGKKFLSVKGSAISDKYAAQRGFKIVTSIDDFLKEDS